MRETASGRIPVALLFDDKIPVQVNRVIGVIRVSCTDSQSPEFYTINMVVIGFVRVVRVVRIEFYCNLLSLIIIRAIRSLSALRVNRVIGVKVLRVVGGQFRRGGARQIRRIHHNHIKALVRVDRIPA